MTLFKEQGSLEQEGGYFPRVFSTSVSSVTSTGPSIRSVEEQAMVSQRPSASRHEVIRFEQHLLLDNFARNTENVPVTKDKDGLATAYTKDDSCSTSVSSLRSTDLSTISAGNHGAVPNPSSVSRRARIYLYPDQTRSPVKCDPDAEKVPAIIKISDSGQAQCTVLSNEQDRCVREENHRRHLSRRV